MGYQNFKPDGAIGNGGAGTPEVWDIISDSVYDFSPKIVGAFMSLDDAGGTMDEMEEETFMSRAGRAGVSEAVDAKYLAYTYPYSIPFEGRYTKLVPSANCLFKVWFIK